VQLPAPAVTPPKNLKEIPAPNTIHLVGIFQDQNRIGKALRDLRKRAGLRQHEIADRMNLTQGWISRVERGHGVIDVELLDGFLDATGFSIYDLIDALYGQEPQPREGRQQVLDAYRLGPLSEEDREIALEKIGSLGWELMKLSSLQNRSQDS
jgi:transcriptional regulator with XRE-family HTH domain